MEIEVYDFFEKSQKWKEEYILLRKIVLENKFLDEEYKWMHPCYTYKVKNVLIIHGGQKILWNPFFQRSLVERSRWSLDKANRKRAIGKTT